MARRAGRLLRGGEQHKDRTSVRVDAEPGRSVRGVEIADFDETPRVDRAERARLLEWTEVLRDLEHSGGRVLEADRASRHEERRPQQSNRRQRIVAGDRGILKLVAGDDGRVARMRCDGEAVL